MSCGSLSGADEGGGAFGTALGVLVAVLFMTFSAQVLVGLYATTALRGAVHDAASRAASQAVTADGVDRGELDRLAAQAESSLGRMGERTSVSLDVVGLTDDGAGDVVVGEALARPPRLVPASLGGMVGFEEVHVAVQVRVERPRP